MQSVENTRRAGIPLGKRPRFQVLRSLRFIEMGAVRFSFCKSERGSRKREAFCWELGTGEPER
jgi:hypothetical protein